MALRTLSAGYAIELDKMLMSSGGFSIDQLMELAGLSVSQAVYKVHPPSAGPRILIACGPGNNGGDGLVAARHLVSYGYKPTIYYPKRSGFDHYERLVRQLANLHVTFTNDFSGAIKETDHILDAVFGFSFSGDVREPFPPVIEAMTKTSLPVTSIDAPSSWNIQEGPPREGLGSEFMPQTLVSLTAAKPLVRYYTGRHFVGGRFLSADVAARFGIEVPPYEGLDQVVEVPSAKYKL